jgi:hypothetical protein
MRVDAGTSIALFAQAREDFHEQTAMEAVLSFLQTSGRPHQITFDRDPRWVGSVSGRDFPSPLLRLLLCLGITPAVCPPHRPDKNAYVERYHRTYGQECLQLHRPSTRKARARGHRGVSPALQRRTSPPRANLWQCPASCGLSDLASLTRSRHPRVDPDAWLTSLNRKMYLRHVGRDGCVELDLATYSIGPQLAGRTVLFQVRAENRQFAVWHQDQVVKLLPIKGLVGQEMVLSDYLKSIQREALAAPRRSSARGPRKVRQPSRMAVKALDSLLHPPPSSGACSAFEHVRETCCLPAEERRRKTRSNLLGEQPLSMHPPHSAFFLSPASAFPDSTSAVSMSLPRLPCR